VLSQQGGFAGSENDRSASSAQKEKARTDTVPTDKSSQMTVLDPRGNPQLAIRRHFFATRRNFR
jgi:hypothetical protein